MDRRYPTTFMVMESLVFAHMLLVGRMDPTDPLAVHDEHKADVLAFDWTERADTIVGDFAIRWAERHVAAAEMLTDHAIMGLVDGF
ncbi:hypothetical protein DYB32_005076 [Aphanomyces invadans]|nr:hypothetical protein DYB32_005076 [Aphanomyces invadans]